MDVRLNADAVETMSVAVAWATCGCSNYECRAAGCQLRFQSAKAEIDSLKPNSAIIGRAFGARAQRG